MTKQRMGFRAALDWLINNDDSDLTSVEYLSNAELPSSVTSSFVAECFGKSDDQLRKSLIARIKKVAAE